MSKYHSKKTSVDGIIFDSKKEAKRYRELKLLEQAGEIANLRRQVKYTLIEPQYIPTGDIYKRGSKKGQPKMKLAERECAYYADFVYTDKMGNTVVEDTKGMKTQDYKIKRKLMLYKHGIRIKEV